MLADNNVEKDYYSILGVPVTADQAEIKAAWKKLIKQWHPDVCRLADAQARFIECSEAYQVLNDEYARRRYDYLRQENLHDLMYYRRQRDFGRYQHQARSTAEHFAVLPVDHLLGLMLQSAFNLAQCLFLCWFNTALYSPFGYLDSRDK